MKNTKETGIVRNFDDLGRVVIPKEIRKMLGFENNSPVEILKVNDTVVLRKPANSCVVCNEEVSKDSQELLNINYCDKCLLDLKDKINSIFE